MHKKKLTILYDLETSGFKGMPMFSDRHKILQICAFCLETRQTFNSFVNPNFESGIPAYSSRIHNIHQSDVEKASSIEVVLTQMYEFFNFSFYDTIELIAHNNKYFDELMIMKEYKTVPNQFVPDNVVFWDTLPWLRENKQGLDSYRLEDLYYYFFKKKIDNAHRADADVLALTEIYQKHIEPFRDKEIAEYELLKKMVYKECLTSIRFVGEYRACLMYYSEKIETVTQLKNFANLFILKGEMSGFDQWLKNVIGIKDITSRMFVIAHVYEIPIWMDEIFKFIDLRHVPKDCLSEIDYFIKYRYCTKERAPNRQLYHIGLMKMFNKIDY